MPPLYQFLYLSKIAGRGTRRRYPGQRRLCGQPTARFHVGQGLAQGQDGWCGPETLSLSASASCRVLSCHLARHSHCRPPSVPPKRQQTARQPPVYPNSSPDHRACNSLTPFHGSRIVHRWIRAKAALCPLPECLVRRGILLEWRLVGRVCDQAPQARREHLHLPLFSGMVAAHVVQTVNHVPGVFR